MVAGPKPHIAICRIMHRHGGLVQVIDAIFLVRVRCDWEVPLLGLGREGVSGPAHRAGGYGGGLGTGISVISEPVPISRALSLCFCL